MPNNSLEAWACTCVEDKTWRKKSFTVLSSFTFLFPPSHPFPNVFRFSSTFLSLRFFPGPFNWITLIWVWFASYLPPPTPPGWVNSLLLHVSREFCFVKLICRNLYALFSHVRNAYTANQNGVAVFTSIIGQRQRKRLWANQGSSSFAFKWLSRFGGFLAVPPPNFSSENGGDEGFQ